MSTKRFNSYEFATKLSQEIAEYTPTTSGSENKNNIRNKVYQFYPSSGDKLQREINLDFNPEQAGMVSHFIGEWAFDHKEELIKSNLPKEEWDSLIENLVVSALETAKTAHSKSMTSEQSVKLMENAVQLTYEETINKLASQHEIKSDEINKILKHPYLEEIKKFKAENLKNLKMTLSVQKKKLKLFIKEFIKFTSGVCLYLIGLIGSIVSLIMFLNIYIINKLILIFSVIISSIIAVAIKLNKNIKLLIIKLKAEKKNKSKIKQTKLKNYSKKILTDEIRIELANNQYRKILSVNIMELKQKFSYELGYILPRIKVIANYGLAENEYNIYVRDQLFAKDKVIFGGKMLTNKVLITDNIEIKSEWLKASHPITKEESYWIKDEDQENFKNINLIDPINLIIDHLESVLINNADTMFTLEKTKQLIEQSKSIYLDDFSLPLATSRKIFVNLIREEVSIKDINLILQTLIEFNSDYKDSDFLSEQLRKKFSRQISSKYMNKQNELNAIKLPQYIEELFVYNKPSLSSLADSIEVQMNAEYLKNEKYPVVLCSADIRLNFYRELKQKVKYLPLVVLSDDELADYISVKDISNFQEFQAN
ncbi:MAG: FHIPEP family type III secretion protein [bacterium]